MENDVTMTARMTMFEHCKDILTRVASLFAKKIQKGAEFDYVKGYGS